MTIANLFFYTYSCFYSDLTWSHGFRRQKRNSCDVSIVFICSLCCQLNCHNVFKAEEQALARLVDERMRAERKSRELDEERKQLLELEEQRKLEVEREEARLLEELEQKEEEERRQEEEEQKRLEEVRSCA